MFQQTTEFLGNHQIRTPIKLYIQDLREFLMSLGFRVDVVDDDDDDEDDDDDDVVVVVTFNAQVAKLCVARWKPWSWTCALVPQNTVFFDLRRRRRQRGQAEGACQYYIV